METSIFQKDREYVSASIAGKKLGYTSDYIGQLCRAGKVPGKLIGRTWFVDLHALLSHKKNRRLGKPKTEKGVAPSRLASNIHNTTKVKINRISVLSYAKDNRELVPVLHGRRGSHLKVAHRFRAGDHVFSSLLLIFTIMLSFVLLENELPIVYDAVREKIYYLALVEEEVFGLQNLGFASSAFSHTILEQEDFVGGNPLLMNYAELQQTALYKGYLWTGHSAEMANTPVENPFGK